MFSKINPAIVILFNIISSDDDGRHQMSVDRKSCLIFLIGRSKDQSFSHGLIPSKNEFVSVKQAMLSSRALAMLKPGF